MSALTTDAPASSSAEVHCPPRNPAAPDGLDLPGEDAVVAVVVRDSRERRRVGVECDGRERRTFATGLEATDELCRQMLRLGRGATVTRCEELPAVAERARD